ncbi:hypothetical protein [Candidatus Nitrosocosmicus sp. FF01]|uniref:hypothetical protein n=1 Tax=Candidatus Nitrosocosmicus sp. FF01 TaxID=3397670 RepID=UPI0039E9FF0C
MNIDSNTNFNKKTNITNVTATGGHDKHQSIDIYINAFTASMEFYSRLNSSFVDALFVSFTETRHVVEEIKKQVIGDNNPAVYRLL